MVSLTWRNLKAEFLEIVEWWLPGAGVWMKGGIKGTEFQL